MNLCKNDLTANYIGNFNFTYSRKIRLNPSIAIPFLHTYVAIGGGGGRITPQSLFHNNFVTGEDLPKIPKLGGREFNCASS
jgi:hypothetical protein